MGKDANHRGSQPQRTRFARLDHDLLRSTAYRSLSPSARALLVEFAMMFNLKNNGELYLSVRDAAARMGVSDHNAASSALAELMDMGFIDMAADGVFSSSPDKPSKARCWRLTWEAAPGRSASFDYREAVVRGQRPARRAREGRLALDRYASGKNRGAKSNTVDPITVVETNTVPGNYSPDTHSSVLETNTGLPQNRPITVDEHRYGNQHTSRNTTTGAAAGELVTAFSTPLKASGPISAADMDRLREDVRRHVTAGGYGAQKNLSKESGVAAPVLSRFRSGGSLPQVSYVPLRLALVKLAGDRRAA